MRILSIGKKVEHPALSIDSVRILDEINDWDGFCYDYVIIHGGDGTIRRVVHRLHRLDNLPTFIVNPVGSFNVVAKIHRAPKIEDILQMLAEGKRPVSQKHHLFLLNDECFLFSAGNMGDLQHIFISETLRFGLLKHGMAKYLLAALLLLPAHLLMTPFMLMSKRRFFIFTPLRALGRIGSFYGEVPRSLTIDLDNEYNFIELDGDVTLIKERLLHIREGGSVKIVTGKGK